MPPTPIQAWLSLPGLTTPLEVELFVWPEIRNGAVAAAIAVVRRNRRLDNPDWLNRMVDVLA